MVLAISLQVIETKLTVTKNSPVLKTVAVGNGLIGSPVALSGISVPRAVEYFRNIGLSESQTFPEERKYICDNAQWNRNIKDFLLENFSISRFFAVSPKV